MKKGNWVGILIAVLVVVGVIVLASRLISGAFALLSGTLDTVLGIVLILAMVAIVAWMFLYAKKKRK